METVQFCFDQFWQRRNEIYRQADSRPFLYALLIYECRERKKKNRNLNSRKALMGYNLEEDITDLPAIRSETMYLLFCPEYLPMRFPFVTRVLAPATGIDPADLPGVNIEMTGRAYDAGYISQLVKDFTSHKLTEVQQADLEQWKYADFRHALLFDELIDQRNIADALTFFRQLDTDTAVNAICHRISFTPAPSKTIKELMRGIFGLFG